MNSDLKDIIISVLYWTIAILFSVTIRFLGIDFFTKVSSEQSMGFYYLVSLPGAVLGGLLFGLVEILDNKFRLKTNKSFGFVVISKTIIYIIVFFIVTFFASWFGMGSINMAKQFLFSKISLSNFVFFAVASLLYHFFKQMNKKFGPGILLKYLTGKYFNPIEEERIFMFLDLKSSTTIAEKLSHVRYSKLIQECFAELTNPIIDYNAEIYQYVGDEAVITWKKAIGLKGGNCLNFYFDYVKRLESRKDYFLNEYNQYPEFKAGVSMGLVTVAEVGELKTEIAYHGDVLNTAARIQGFCNKFNKQLLVSESLVLELDENTKFVTELMGEVELRGKEELTRIHSCEKPVNLKVHSA